MSLSEVCLGSKYSGSQKVYRLLFALPRGERVRVTGRGRKFVTVTWLSVSLKGRFSMSPDTGLQAEYHLTADHLTWEGHLHRRSLSGFPDYVKLLLPPVRCLPSFQILLNDREPFRRQGRLAIFKTTSTPLNFRYQFYLPGICSFYQLSELCPRWSLPPSPTLSP